MKLENTHIIRLVNMYIGVNGGYLGDFSYNSHFDFYPEYCGLNINPNDYEGTTRQRFIRILETSEPKVQAKIIRGVLSRFPVGQEYAPASRMSTLYEEYAQIVNGLEGAPQVSSPTLQMLNATIEKAIKDVEVLIQSGNPTSGTDRIHTGLHGYLRLVCDAESIMYLPDDGIAKLLKKIQQQHPKFQGSGPVAEAISKILNSMGNILDSLNQLRNHHSLAHANQNLLESNEALLTINTTRTILQYVDGKLR